MPTSPASTRLPEKRAWILAITVALVVGSTSLAGCGDESSEAPAQADDAPSAPSDTALSDSTPPSTAAIDFEPFVPPDPALDPRDDRLCDETDTFDDPAAEKHDLTCVIDGATLAPEPPADPPDEVVVMTWNVERGYELDGEIELLLDDTDAVPTPDILLASEVDRGCDRSEGRDVAREIAEALEWNYVFGVEFVEGVRDDLTTPCEHGQAVFSRFPLGDVEVFRHTPTGTDRYDNPDEPRIGTRADVAADVLVGDSQVRAVAVHYDDLATPPEEAARNLQARESAERWATDELPVVVAGDMNTALYFLDPTPASTRSTAARIFWEQGWFDTHVDLPERVTVPYELDGRVFPAIADLLWVRDRSAATDAAGCPEERCGGLSDHLPQWFTLSLR